MAYSITPTPYGFHITFSGNIPVTEMVKWHMDSVQALKIAKRPFSCLIDMSQMGTLPQDSKAELAKGQDLYKRMGMVRSAVLVPTRMIAKQLKDMASESGILPNERYISIEVPNAQAKAEAYCQDGIEPE